MATLTGTTIQSTYDSLLKVTDNDAITASLKRITDGLGNNTPLYLSSTAVEISSGLNVIGAVTASNVSGTNTGDETKASIETKLGAATAVNSGYLTSTDWSTFSAKIAGSGTLNKLAKFSSSSSIADSTITDTGSAVTIGVATSITGSLTASSIIRTGGTSSQFLKADGSVDSTTYTPTSRTLTINGTAYDLSANRSWSVGTVDGTGTTNTLPKFTGASTIGNSNISDNGTQVTIGVTTRINGNVGLNVAPTTNVNLRISSGLTGSVSPVGILLDGVIQSDATSTAAYNRVTSSTAAASFTVTNLNYYQATQGTFGAGSTVTAQTGFSVSNNTGALNNYGFRGQISAGLNNYNLFNDGAAKNYMFADLGIGSSQNFVSSGPILTTTLTDGGTGYVDGTYTDVASVANSGSGVGALFTVVVSGGIVTSATLTWSGSNYRVGDTITISNTLLGGSGSGLVITADTVDSSPLKVSNANGGDITLVRADSTLALNDNIGSIKFENNDTTTKSSGLQARISAYGAGAAGGAYLSFFTRSATAGTSLVEAMRILDNSNVNIVTGGLGIGSTTLSTVSLRISKTITGGTAPISVFADGVIQSDATSSAIYFRTNASTAAATFTLPTLTHYQASQATLGAGSIVTNQIAFLAQSDLIGATNNYGFRGLIGAGTNRWNLYMDGTADNYMAGSLGIGTNSLTGHNLRINKTITGATAAYGIRVGGVVQSDVTSSAAYYYSGASTQATTFTLGTLIHFHAVQSTIGAGSTVTNQAGYWASSGMIGATNNFGFYGDIPSGTGRWNLYMAGTARNYLAGTTSIGSTTDNGTGALLQVAGGITYRNIFNRVTTNYTLVLTDQNDIVETNVASANNVTVPPNSSVAFPIGTEIAVLQYGAGQTTIVAGVGVTLRSKSNALKISGQYAGCTLVKVGTDEWYVVGDLVV